MFFVRKENIGTPLGTQKEFAAAQRRGIGFFVDRSANPANHVWHYFWPIEMIEPGIRNSVQVARAEPVVGEEERAPTHVIWSQEVTLGATVGDPVISGFTMRDYEQDEQWKTQSREAWQRAHVALLSGAAQ